ncbi:MAG TPA: GDP-mannose mannosyl hydrolase [Gammaproteobacteria bacterium]|nr:GDP-mannose mannosyl hydrolase [Gammaproteobacteria bacterium]
MIEDRQFLKIIEQTPLVSIDLIVENSQGEFLLGKRVNPPAQGFWFVPGGRIRKNETIADAFRRISATELGVSLSLPQAQLLGAYDHIYNDNFLAEPGINTHYVVLGYALKLMDTSAIVADDQHSQFRWWSRRDLLAANDVHENTKRYFE